MGYWFPNLFHKEALEGSIPFADTMENLFENHITNTDLDGNVWFYDQNGKPKMVVSKEQFEALCEYKKQQLTITE